MKKMPMVILIPMIAILVVLGFAMGVKFLSQKPAIPTEIVGDFPNPITAQATNKPSTFLGRLFGADEPTPTSTPATSNDLLRQLDTTIDDGGAAELNALEEDTSGL